MFSQVLCLLYLLTISFFDLCTGRIPNFITFGFFAFMLLIDIFIVPSKIPGHLLCAAFFFFLFLCISLLTKGLGMGDVKLAAVVGYCKGFFDTSYILILASILGLFIFIFSHFLKKEIKKIPYAPFITAGYLVSEMFYRRIL